MIRVHFTGPRNEKLQQYVTLFQDAIMMQGRTQKRYKIEDVPVLQRDEEPDFLIIVEEEP